MILATLLVAMLRPSILPADGATQEGFVLQSKPPMLRGSPSGQKNAAVSGKSRMFAAKGLEADKDLPETKKEEDQPKPWTPLSTLAEQWGLLGFALGLVASLGGIGLFMGNMEVTEVDVDAVLEMASSGMGGQPSASTRAAFSVAGADLAEALASASAIGLASGYAGLVVDGAQERLKATGGTFLTSDFVASMGPPGELSVEAEQQLRTLFDTCDKSGDGYVEISELVDACENTPEVIRFFVLKTEGMSDEEKKTKLDRLFKVMDTNLDGVVSWEEFRSFCVSYRLEAGIQVEDRPRGALALGMRTFEVEWRQLLLAAASRGVGPVSRSRHVPSFVPKLVLSNQAVIDREEAREPIPTPAPVKVVYDVLCKFIDICFEDRPIPRFWFLETVARMPYFAYTSVLHLYETLGWWRSPELRAVHEAEEDNELHHLLIMESLGGDQRWFDRFLAQHGAVAYYWILVIFFVIDPRWSYNFSRLIEFHAIDTYGEFVDANEELLKKLPPPPVAVEYYRTQDLYLFDKFQTSMWGQDGKTKPKDKTQLRRPPCSTLYDVFSNIRDDEEQHVLTMQACEEWVDGGAPPVTLGYNVLDEATYLKEVQRTPEGREAWQLWSEEIQALTRKGKRT